MNKKRRGVESEWMREERWEEVYRGGVGGNEFNGRMNGEGREGDRE